MMMRKTVSERFSCKIVKNENGCMEWSACRDGCGYGMFLLNGKYRRAHRVAWEMRHGPIPDGLNCLHKCDNPPCVNPDHLWLGTQKDNVCDMMKKGRDRKAFGDRNASRLYPERRPRGDRHYSRIKPECLARGDRNGSRTCPESRPKGVGHWKAKLSETDVREMRADYASGGVSYGDLALRYGVKKTTVASIITRRIWKHI